MADLYGRATTLEEQGREDGQVVGHRDTGRGPTRPRAAFRYLVWALALLLAIGGVTWIVRNRREATPERRPGRFGTGGPVSVVAAPVKKGDLPVTLTALGTVVPLATVTVKTQIFGRLMSISFTEGQMVKAGDFLALVDPRPYEVALEQAQAQLVRDEALLRNAELDLTRYRTLAAQDSIPQQQLDTQEYLVRQYQGTVKADQSQVDSAKLNLDYCHIIAPVSGRVGLRQVDVGNNVQPTDSSGIVVITQLQPISVIFTLPEDNVPAVMKSLRKGSSVPVTAYDRTLSTKLASGELATVDNQIDTTTGTVKLRASFANTDDALFPNQFVTTTLLIEVLHDATIVPASAVQRGAPGTFVYVVNPDRTVSLRPVKLGPAEGERVAVQSGLTAGEQVVVDGADKLKDGAKILLPGAADGPPAGDRPPRDESRKGRRTRPQ